MSDLTFYDQKMAMQFAKAKKLTIRAEVFNNGAKNFELDLAGFVYRSQAPK